MKHKVLGSVFVLAVALGLISVTSRTPIKPVLPKSYEPVEKMLAGFNIKPKELEKARKHADSLARPLASYRVRTTETPGTLTFKSSVYDARLSEDGFRFGSKEFAIELGAPRVRQGDLTLELAKGKVTNPEHGVGEVDRGGVIEKYVFENNRAEQFFTFPKPLAEGALEVRLPVLSNLPGAVIVHEAMKEGFKEMQFLKGGLAFTDGSGATRLAYHSAIVMDAAGQQHRITPRFENKEIVLPVPAGFMSRAVYPVMIDPWFDLAGSGTGGGITSNGSVSDRPAMVMTGAGLPYIAWSDLSAADNANPQNSDIYVTAWTGFQFIALATSLSPGGISNNPGRSTNPSISLGAFDAGPFVAWQDDSNGFTQIYLKGLKGTSWQEYSGSATLGGLSRAVGPSQHPSVESLIAVVPGSSSTAATFESAPVVAYDDLTNRSAIRVLVHYPGQVGVPAGWFQFMPTGQGTHNNFMFFSGDPSNNLGAINEYPALQIDGLGNPVVAWHGTNSGNYEIYVRTYTLNNGGQFFVAPGTAIGTFAMVGAAGAVPPGVMQWNEVSGSGSGGGISNTAGHSQYPSLAVDTVGSTNNYTVAWQETLPAAPPGTTSQIYLRRSTAGGAWAELAGSGSGLGISQSTQNATAPALGSNGGYLCVAWADDTNANSEIYARRFRIGGSVQWEQIGYQGSAFPSLGSDIFAPIEGLSKTANVSLKPSIAVDFVGNPTVAWMDGNNGRFDILLKQFSPNGPGTAAGTDFTLTLRQTLDDPTLGAGTDLAVGGSTANTDVFLSSRVFTENLIPVGSALRIEFEIQPGSAGFKGTPTGQSLPVVPDSTAATPGNIAVFHYQGLPDTVYKWQARTVDQMGRRSPWFAFPTAQGGSFRIDNTSTVPPGGTPTPTPPTFIATDRSKGSCGLLGLEALLALGLIRVLRRKR